MTTQITRVNAADLKKQINDALELCAIEKLVKLDTIDHAFALASGTRALQAALNKQIVEDVFMPLMGSRLGFRTDLDTKEKKYGWEVVRDVLIEAFMRGFQPVNNEFNIIAGNFYAAQTGFERKIKEFPGLTDLVLEFGIPVQAEGSKTSVVAASAVFKLNGTDGVFECVKREGGKIDTRLPVRVNEGQGPDAVMGKAKRKFFARFYEFLSGIKTPEGNALDTDGVEITGDAPNDASTAKLASMMDRQQARTAEANRSKARPTEEKTESKKTREPGEDG